MVVEKIIEKMKENLGNNKDDNIKYLKEVSEQYKEHEHSKEILREIGRLIFENISDDKTEELNKIIDKEVVKYYNKAIKYVEKGKLDKAKNELLKFVEPTENMFEDDLISTYYSPSNGLEFLLLCEIADKNVRDIGINFSDGYLYLGGISIEQKDYKRAIEYLNKAIRWNPYHVKARFELAEVYKIQKNMEKYKEITLESINYIYYPEDFGRYCRNLGYYCIEKEEFETAKCLYLFSLQFDSNSEQLVNNEINYIFSKQKNLNLPDMEKVMQIINSFDFPTFLNEKVIVIIFKLFESAKKDNQLESNLGQLLSYIPIFYAKFVSF